MKVSHGFGLIGLLISVAIIAVIATYGMSSYYSSSTVFENESPQSIIEKAKITTDILNDKIKRSSFILDPSQIIAEVKRGDAILLDVRTTDEILEYGKAVSSTHISFDDTFHKRISDIDMNKTIYVYCKGGVRAEEARGVLLENGYTNVINIGGLTDWKNAGGQVIIK